MDSCKKEFVNRLKLLNKDQKSIYFDTENTFSSLAFLAGNFNNKLSLEIEEFVKKRDFSQSNIERFILDLSIKMLPMDSNTDINKLNFSVRHIDGVGEKLRTALNELGIFTVSNLLLTFPSSYNYIAEGAEKRLYKGKYLRHEYIKTSTAKSYLLVIFSGDAGLFGGVWFNFNKKYPLPFIMQKNELLLYGSLGTFKGVESVIHPEFIEEFEVNTIRVSYPLNGKVSSKIFSKIVANAFSKYGEYFYETLPEHILQTYNFPSIRNCLKNIHFPKGYSIIEELSEFRSIYHKRFIFEELFYLQLGFLSKKIGYTKNKGIAFHVHKELLNIIRPYIKFRLTGSQRKVVSEILNDMAKDVQMNRLLQGDVGSGKTIVAFVTAIIAILNGYQVAVIAPTEILAEQHFNNFKSLIGEKFKSELLTSSVKSKDKNNIKSLIKNGDIDFIFGTHAIIQNDVGFKNLGLAIIDEQHRFGVKQRKALSDKGYNPDILLMSATPIPRTLALTLYGDLDISIIDEMPPGRTPIFTRSFSQKNEEKVYKLMKNEIQNGNLVYVVYPLIKESEKIDLKSAEEGFLKFKNIFDKEDVGLIHGKMSSEEKRVVMENFRNKVIKILVSTTVIEVGVDVPDATVMVIQNAERFGLSQLHQLRGRIGRSNKKSYCYLIYADKISEEGLKRIFSMEKYSGGFRLAEIDLEMRGPGDFFGVRQSGIPGFRFSNIVRDTDILLLTRDESQKIIEKDPDLSSPEHIIIKQILLDKWKNNLDFLQIG